MKRYPARAMLLFLSAAFLLNACGSSTTTEQSTAQTTSADTAIASPDETETTADPRYTDAIGDYDFGGEEFHFLLFGDGDPYNWS